MKRFLARFSAGILGLAVLGYALDYLSVQYRIPAREPFAVIRVDQLYAIPNKWKEVDWSRGNPVMEQCVNSLLPHFGLRPCWYVKRDTMHVNEL